MAKKTLAEQIADLQTPVNPDFDIEDNERGLFDHRADGSDNSGLEDEETNDALRIQHYVKTSKSTLRDNGINIRDKKYTGKPSSRKSIFDESDNEENENTDELISDDDDEEEIDGEDSQADNQEIDNDESDSGISLRVDSEDEEELESEEEAPTDEEEITSKRDKIKSLMASERKSIISRLSSSTQTDALKGYAVINQQRVFDSIIDARIKVQKAMTHSNYLPLNKEIVKRLKTDDTADQLAIVENSIHELLNGILALRTKIFNKEKMTKEPLKLKTNKKRSFKDFCEETAKCDDILNKHSDLVLTKWSHKVQSASGSSALNASKFKAINQSAAQQVQSNLIDMDRLVKRTRLNRRNIKPIGYVNDDSAEQQVDRSLKEDSNVFDDEDFYRVLLNDLVDKKISDSNPVNGLTIQLTKTKLKKNVDTKASKGRKLRYSIQDKIQNWEAPNGSFKWNDEQIDEFFAGLLGQRINFEEDVEESTDNEKENSSDDGEELLKNDDLQIFG